MKNISPLLIIVIVLFCACGNQKSLEDMQDYEGPNGILKDVKTLLSDSGIVRIRLTAPTQIDETNGNQTFPDGIQVEFFQKDGTISSVLTANEGKFDRLTQIYTAIGNVVVVNTVEEEQLKTELLNWDPEKKRVYTDKFVTIETEDELLQGEGLEASQDFSVYRILKPRGTLSVEDEEEEDDE